ncbi:MAG: FAD-binding protein, partial [Candidatus Bathyarchaeia archaeon]
FIQEPELSNRYASFLTDESRLKGFAERLAAPESEEEIAAVLSAAAEASMPVTISGSRTGITGGAAPLGGCVLSCSAMKKFLGLRRCENRFLLRCQPGVTLAELNTAVSTKSFPASEEWTGPSVDALAELAKKNLETSGFSDRVTIIHGDGSLGYTEKAPFDRILATAAAPEIPPPLIEQLRVGGVLVLPVGDVHLFQVLMRIRKISDGRLVKENLGDVAFVPLTGRYGHRT